MGWDRRIFLPIGLIASMVASWAVAEDWLPPGSTTEMSGVKPAELLDPSQEFSGQILLGRLLFRSPSILGEKAVRIGMSCDSCHTNGHVNTSFYIEGLSDLPGRIDVTHRFWQAGFEDNTDNPIDIPSLRNVKNKSEFGTRVIFSSLPAFTRHVIATEFAGPQATGVEINALVSYMSSLDINGLDTRYIYEETDIDSPYTDLLFGPVEDQDFPQLDVLIDLIRADLGRQVSNDTEEEISEKIRLMLSLRTSAAAGNYETAKVFLEKLRR
ncbi:hypothetical protein NBZ79_04110 [Sneathiella marina]|uniref:Cytochrome c domain-containing protein n=1 Tax=Sneathiella marina TaxID=2950108 RepID=A0ABY4W5R7_9PROT|nr:hypothetical protein [Sneathiella marina]USG62159.1 hypothetical protein NBZ79_04110 [Sneathiella marina]